MKISESIINLGVTDIELDIFEGQYPLKNGVTYNYYMIIDAKIAILDSVDKRKSKDWR